MAEMEYKAGVKIDTGESQATIKQLKKQVQELTALMGKLETGTYEYDKVCTELVNVQTQLTTAMKAGKSQLSAQDGSYNALVNRMKALKDVMKATTDEAKRNQLSAEINEINNALKEMDAAQGVHSRNVGNYTESVVNAYQQIRKEIKQYQSEVLSAEEGTEEYEQAMNRLSQAQFAMRDMNEKARYAVADFGEQLANVTGIASGLMSGFSAVQGAMVLCGAETQDFEKTMIKLQSAMAIVQGLQGLEGINDRIVGLTQTIKIAAKSMGKGGWIGTIIAVGTVVAALTAKLIKKNKEIKNGTAALKDYTNAANENVGAASEQIVKIKLLDKVSRDAATADELRTTAARELLTVLGEVVDDTNILAVKNGEYADSIKNKVIPALIAQARMEGAMDLIKEKQKEILEQQVEVNERMSEAPTGWDKVWAGMANSATAAEGGASINVSAEDMKAAGVAREKKRLEQLEKDFGVYVENLFKDSDSKSILQALGISTDDKDTKEEVENGVMTAKEALEVAHKQIMETLEEDLENLDFDLDIDDDLFKNMDDRNKALKSSAEYQIKLAENTARREIEMLNLKAQKEKDNAMQTIEDADALAIELERIENERKVEEANINLELAEKKKSILNDWVQHNTDASILLLEIEQALADNEVEIAKAKYAQLKALREQSEAEESTGGQEQVSGYKKAIEDFKKSWDDMDWQGKMNLIGSVTSEMLYNTSDILNSVADMYESNGVESEKEAKKIKNLRIAGATIDTINGAITAYMSAQSLGVPLGPIIGGINAATVTAMGLMNINKIKNTEVSLTSGGSSSSSLGASVTPSPATYTSELPATYTRQLTGASEIEELNKEQRVYILESDIQQSNRRVEIRQSESSF